MKQLVGLFLIVSRDGSIVLGNQVVYVHILLVQDFLDSILQVEQVVKLPGINNRLRIDVVADLHIDGDVSVVHVTKLTCCNPHLLLFVISGLQTSPLAIISCLHKEDDI